MAAFVSRGSGRFRLHLHSGLLHWRATTNQSGSGAPGARRSAHVGTILAPHARHAGSMWVRLWALFNEIPPFFPIPASYGLECHDGRCRYTNGFAVARKLSRIYNLGMTARLVPYLGYPDARAAVEWLVALGFTTLLRQDAEDGSVQHAELEWKGSVIMVFNSADGTPVGSNAGGPGDAGLYLVTEDVAGLYSAAIELGAESVLPPETTPWGSSRARVIDPGGREWTFGSYIPGTSKPVNL